MITKIEQENLAVRSATLHHHVVTLIEIEDKMKIRFQRDKKEGA